MKRIEKGYFSPFTEGLYLLYFHNSTNIEDAIKNNNTLIDKNEDNNPWIGREYYSD